MKKLLVNSGVNEKSEWTTINLPDIAQYDEYGKYDELHSKIHYKFRSNLNLQSGSKTNTLQIYTTL